MSSASAGRVLLIPKGDYNASATYSALDVVVYNHDSYVAKKSTKGNLPTNTTYWQPLTNGYGEIASLKETLTNLGLTVVDGKVCQTYNE